MGTLLQRNDKRERFEKTALSHLDSLYGMALRLTRNPQDAEDLVQDAMVRAFRFCERFEPGTNMKAWLFKILTNTFYNQVRKTSNTRRVAAESEAGEHYDQFISAATMSGRNAEGTLHDNISSERLRLAVEELPEEFRLAVILCDVYEFSYREISEILACPIGTVMSRLYRGRQRLQHSLHQYGLERGMVKEDDSSAAQATDLLAYREKRR